MIEEQEIEQVVKQLLKAKNNKRDYYFEIDEFSNAVDYLKKSHYFLSCFDDPMRWKWISLSLTNALYGLMICAVKGTNRIRVLDFNKIGKKNREKLNSLFEIHKENPNNTKAYNNFREFRHDLDNSGKAKLISFDEALKRIQKPEYMKQFVYSKTVEISEIQKKNILLLRREFRNYFEHFKPVNWSIDTLFFIPLVTDTVSVIRELLCNLNLGLEDKDLKNSAITFCDEIILLNEENERRLS